MDTEKIEVILEEVGFQGKTSGNFRRNDSQDRNREDRRP